jgi:hypothetical protein
LPGPGVVLKNLLDEAETTLAGRNVTKREIGTLLEPVKLLPGDSDWVKGCRWSRAIFRSPEKLGEFYVRDRVKGRVCAGDEFEVLAILPELDLPHEFFVLKLSKKHVALMRGGFSLEAVPIPGVRENIDEFLALDRPDHDRENRSTVRPGGGKGQVRFGTGSERERHAAYLHDFYRAVDRALIDLLNPRGAPLVLHGVDEDTALYRSLSTYSGLLTRAIPGSPDDGVSNHEILQRAIGTVREAATESVVAALAEARERLAPARFSDDPDSIAQLASQGRVGHLFVPAQSNDGKLNAAAVETIRHGGIASALPADRMSTPIAAALRF